MPLNAQATAFLSAIPPRPPRRELTVAQNREQMRSTIASTGPRRTLDEVTDRTLATPVGEVPVRIYRPVADGSLPCLVYLHGGGWVLGDLDTHDTVCRNLSVLAGCVTVAVHYRRAPEHRFPAAVDDTVAACRHVRDRPEQFGVDAHRIAVGGDSAGGNLAAVACQSLRADAEPALVHQLLVYPAVDADPGTWPSYRECATGGGMSSDDMLWYLDQYLPAGTDRTDPRLSPIRAADLSGLPPATVLTAEHDPLRDEGEAYAQALARAGVAVRARRFDGVFHPFFMFPGALDAAAEAQEYAAAGLRAAFSR